MPVVTVPSRPSGEPIATTSWPTRRLPDEPRVMGVSPVAPSAFTTAMSLPGSVPTTVNVVVLPSAKVTLVCTPSARAVLGGGHHVIVGQDQSVGREDDAGTLFGLLCPCPSRA